MERILYVQGKCDLRLSVRFGAVKVGSNFEQVKAENARTVETE